MKILNIFLALLFIPYVYAGTWFWQQGPQPTAQSDIDRQYKVDKERTYHTNVRERECIDEYGNRKPFKLRREITEFTDGQMYDLGYGSCLETPTPYQSNVGPNAPRIPNPAATWHYPRQRYMSHWYARNTGPHKKVLKYWVQPLEQTDKTYMENL